MLQTCKLLSTPARTPRPLHKAAHLTQLCVNPFQLVFPCFVVINEYGDLSSSQQLLAPWHDDVLREVCRACHSLCILLREAVDAGQRGPGAWGSGFGPAGQRRQLFAQVLRQVCRGCCNLSS